jgi:hypothetical protein
MFHNLMLLLNIALALLAPVWLWLSVPVWVWCWVVSILARFTGWAFAVGVGLLPVLLVILLLWALVS